MKLLSDFDGVWTHPREEAAAQGEFLDAQLLEWMPRERREAAREWIARARRAALAEPSRYGWAPGGRLSAFADEDPFAAHSALLHYVHAHREDDETAAALVAAGAAHGFDSLETVGGQAHAHGVARVEASRGPGILPTAATAGRLMLAGDVGIVVVSNSGTDKLVRWFQHAGVRAVVHPERAPGALRLRGAARKFVLDPARSDVREFGGLAVETARPHYEEILREEMPDAVVGDVFSLDLALPLRLKRDDLAWRDVRLFWLVHDYTPSRIRREVERAAGGEVEILEGGLAQVAERLLATS